MSHLLGQLDIVDGVILSCLAIKFLVDKDLGNALPRIRMLVRVMDHSFLEKRANGVQFLMPLLLLVSVCQPHHHQI